MTKPLVTVVCLCYNHEQFAREAIESVLSQTYPNIEVIVVDDASTDNSLEVIRRVIQFHPGVKLLPLKNNLGNCRAFNAGWRMASGEFIVDFSTDDVMLPERIEKQVRYFESSGRNHGVVFTDAVYIDAEGRELRQHFEHLKKHKLIEKIPTGDVYADVIERFFIPAPTMLVRREVFSALDGYDEELAYEDFDFWIRSSRNFSYGFIDETLTRIRLSPLSLSRKVYTAGDRQLHSTYRVCQKIARLNRTPRESAALQRRLRYELRHCVLTGNHNEASLFYQLLQETGTPDLFSRALIRMKYFAKPFSWLRRRYHSWKYS